MINFKYTVIVNRHELVLYLLSCCEQQGLSTEMQWDEESSLYHLPGKILQTSFMDESMINDIYKILMIFALTSRVPFTGKIESSVRCC